jgi:hypothetical protein
MGEGKEGQGSDEFNSILYVNWLQGESEIQVYIYPE